MIFTFLFIALSILFWCVNNKEIKIFFDCLCFWYLYKRMQPHLALCLNNLNQQHNLNANWFKSCKMALQTMLEQFEKAENNFNNLTTTQNVNEYVNDEEEDYEI